MRLLALDCSTHVGWAFFDAAGATPLLGTWHAPRLPDPDLFGAIFEAFERQLARLIHEHAPKVIAFEAPILPVTKTFQKVRAIRLSYGFAASAERVAYAFGLRCVECHPMSVKLKLAGRGNAKKPDMIAAAIRRGFEPATEHEADACGVALLAFDHIDPPQLELDDFAAKSQRTRPGR